MSNQITCTFSIKQWDEAPYSESENGPKLIRASVQQTYSGAIEGEGTLEYLITTFDENFSSFIGSERVTGKLDGRPGSFVLNHKGTHENGVARSSFQIVEGSGTGKLSGIRGEGSFEASHEKASFALDYEFA